jgi:hypothetical protein
MPADEAAQHAHATTNNRPNSDRGTDPDSQPDPDPDS